MLTAPSGLTTDYLDYLEPFDYTTQDLGAGRYNVLDAEGNVLFDATKPLDWTLYELGLDKADPFIKFQDPSTIAGGFDEYGNALAPVENPGGWYFSGVASNNNASTINPAIELGGNNMVPAMMDYGTWGSLDPETQTYKPNYFETEDALLQAMIDSGYFTSEDVNFYGQQVAQDYLGQSAALAPMLLGRKNYVMDTPQARTLVPLDMRNENITGENLDYWGTPVLGPDGSFRGIQYRMPGYDEYIDNNGATRSSTAAGYSLINPDVWKDIGWNLGNGNWYVPKDYLDQVPGFTQKEGYQIETQEDDNGLGGLGGLIGAALGFATGMPWLGGFIGGTLSTGDPLKGVLSGGLGALTSGIFDGFGGGDMYFDDFGVGSNLSAGSQLANVGSGLSFDRIADSVGDYLTSPKMWEGMVNRAGNQLIYNDGEIDPGSLFSGLAGGALSAGLSPLTSSLTDSRLLNSSLNKVLTGSLMGRDPKSVFANTLTGAASSLFRPI